MRKTSKKYWTIIIAFDGLYGKEETEFMDDELEGLKRQVRAWIDGNGFGASAIGARYDVYYGIDRVGVLSYNGKYEEV